MLWKYIKENNLQDPSDKRTIICDESLRSLFPVESINMFQMNKQLAKHIWPLVQEDEGIWWLKGVIIFPEVFISIFFYEYINFCTVFFFPAGTTNDPEKGKQKMKMETDEGTDIHFFNLFMLLSQGEYKIIHLLKLYR